MVERSKTGLVKKKITVKKNGKTYERYQWVKAGEDEPAEKKGKKVEPTKKGSFNIGDTVFYGGKNREIIKVSESQKTVKLNNNQVYTFEAINKINSMKKPDPKKEIKIKDLKPTSKKEINTKDLSKQMTTYTNNLDKLLINNTQNYTSTDFGTLNPYMRENKYGENKVNDKKIDNINKFLKDAPKMNGTVYRGMSFWEDDKDSKNNFNTFMTEIKKNKTCTFKSFTSTSTDKRMVEQTFTSGGHDMAHSVIFEIKSKAGVYLNGVSDFPKEHEVLFNKNSKFKILKINDKNPNNIKIIMEEI